MRYSFNGREYRRHGHNNNGLGQLIFEIFKYYLEQNPNKSYQELKDIFNPLHNWGNKVVFNQENYRDWREKNLSRRAEQRYFNPIRYNDMDIYFTTQWGDNGGERNNITRFLTFAINDLKYNIETLNTNEILNTRVQNHQEKSSKQNKKIKNIILYGVPGVGKTYSHKKLIDIIESKKYSDSYIFENIENHNNLVFFEKAKEENRVEFITFHQSFGYEDFIEGFRPNEEGNIKLQNGVFKEFCKKAEEQRDKNFYLVIDEINRANISKVFGELITLIEEDKRDSLHVTLPHSKDEFSIPSNLYIIGTMNSTDKSIALIDIALRRRFTFIQMSPNPELVKNLKAKKLMIELNSKLDSEYHIGHSYFMNIEDEEDLIFTCKYKIKPLLEEYFYGDKEGLKSILEVSNHFLDITKMVDE